MRFHRSALGIAGFLTLAAGVAATSPAPAPPQPPYGEEIDVRVVNVEVVVTDRRGERITGLEPSDFVLTVDGQPVDVEFFSEVRDGASAAPPSTTATAGAPAAGDSGVRPITAAAAGIHYLVFVDDFFSIGAHRDFVLQALQRDLARMRPQDRMAVVAFDGGRLTPLSGWSSSREQLAGAFDRALERPTRGLQRLTELRGVRAEETLRDQLVDGAMPLDLSARSGELTAAQGAYGSILLSQLSASADATAGAMRAFADAPGRKVLLLLCGGWPYSVNSYVSGSTGRPVYELPEGKRLLRPLADTANLLGYTVYPVDVPGARAFSGADAEMTTPAPIGSSLFAEMEIEESLLYLARETGGRPLLDGQRGKALAAASDDTRTFYWLGFVPGWRGDDQPHQLGVEVKRPGLRVRARSGFLDLSRQAETSMRLESALLLGSFASELPMAVEVGKPRRVRRGELEWPLVLRLPVDLLTLVPTNGGYGARLELRFVATDRDGAASQIPVVPIELVTDEPPVPGKLVRHEMTVKLRGRADHLVVAAYDPATDRMATAEADLAMP
jgi:VWFA-related protein